MRRVGVYRKWPHFTSGAATSIEESLELVGIDQDTGALYHLAPDLPSVRPLDANERAGLEAFLRLL